MLVCVEVEDGFDALLEFSEHRGQRVLLIVDVEVYIKEHAHRHQLRQVVLRLIRVDE